MIRKYFLHAIFCLVSIFILFNAVSNFNDRTPLFCDETNWVALTSFYDLLVRGDVDNPQWTSYWGYDHPPLAKFIYGYALTSWNTNYSIIRNALVKKYLAEGRICKTTPVEPFRAYIMQMRGITVALLFCIFILLAVSGVLLTRPSIVSVVTPLMMLSHPLLDYLIITTSDSFYIFFFLVSTIFFLLYLSQKKDIYFMLSAITIGLSLISKLTAMIYVASYLLYLSVEMVRLKQWRKDAAKITIFVSIIIVIWIGSNPTLRHDPFNRSVYYFRQRVDSVMSQQKQYVEWKQKSLVEKTAVSYLKIFPMTRSYPDFLLSAIRVGFYLLGVWYSFRKAVKGSTKHLFIILFSLSSSYLLLVTLYLPWNRYLLPLVVFALLFQVIGWNAVYEWAIKKMSFKS